LRIVDAALVAGAGPEIQDKGGPVSKSSTRFASSADDAADSATPITMLPEKI
jgi:hypothetical protein